MPRVSPITRADFAVRSEILADSDRLALKQFAPLARRAGIPKLDQNRCLREINDAFRHYHLERLVLAQERPARAVAALHTLREPARRLLKGLNHLDVALRMELGAGDLENQITEMLDRLKNRMDYWQHHAKKHRRPEAVWARQFLWGIIEGIAVNFSPKLACNEPMRRRWSADVILAGGISVPDVKKNKMKVTGLRR